MEGGATAERVNGADFDDWINWLWAWENPHPDKALVALRCEAGEGGRLSGLAAGAASAHPLRWQTRNKACLTLPPEQALRLTWTKPGGWLRSSWIWGR